MRGVTGQDASKVPRFTSLGLISIARICARSWSGKVRQHLPSFMRYVFILAISRKIGCLSSSNPVTSTLIRRLEGLISSLFGVIFTFTKSDGTLPSGDSIVRTPAAGAGSAIWTSVADLSNACSFSTGICKPSTLKSSARALRPGTRAKIGSPKTCIGAPVKKSKGGMGFFKGRTTIGAVHEHSFRCVSISANSERRPYTSGRLTIAPCAMGA